MLSLLILMLGNFFDDLCIVFELYCACVCEIKYKLNGVEVNLVM